MEICDRFVDLDGLRFHYREAGDAEAPPLVLLHALGVPAADWDGVAGALADGRRVLALESRGSYESPRTERYSFELMRDDLRAFADELGLERFDLVGHSMGGSVAYLFAEEWPERLGRLVIEDTPPPRAMPPRRRASEPPPDLPFDIRMARAIIAQVLDPDPAWWERLGEITAPTLLIAGGPTSHVPREWMAEVAERIPDCRLVEITAGHHVHRERPAEFLAAVGAFLVGSIGAQNVTGG